MGLGAICYVNGGLASLAERCFAPVSCVVGNRFWSVSIVAADNTSGSYHADLLALLHQGCLPPSLVTQ